MSLLGNARECPACKKESQYQHSCPHCGRRYQEADRLNVLLNVGLLTTAVLLLLGLCTVWMSL